MTLTHNTAAALVAAQAATVAPMLPGWRMPTVGWSTVLLRGLVEQDGDGVGDVIDEVVRVEEAVFAEALARGAKQLSPVKDEFYGDRTGQFEDPFGHRWSVASHIEDVPEEEMAKRAEEALNQPPSKES